ncbi:MAG: hypothetical protein HYS86_01710 [Candidatus Chisholmbacteria bacterium]|nr:hypothetical protein [Candidatus Chisholmbacteria bacterium]
MVFFGVDVSAVLADFLEESLATEEELFADLKAISELNLSSLDRFALRSLLFAVFVTGHVAPFKKAEMIISPLKGKCKETLGRRNFRSFSS